MSLILPPLKKVYVDNPVFTLDAPELELSGTGYTCVIGRNGSGKSSYGEALASHKPISENNHWYYLPQYLERFLFAENILEQLTDLLGQSVNHTELEQLLQELGFTDPTQMINFPFILMSGGERRRMALATVSYLKPKQIILDEPEIGITAKENMVLLAKLNNLQAVSAKVILISHNFEFVKRSSDLICLENGRVAKAGSTQDLMADPDFNPKDYGVRFQQEMDKAGLE